MKFRTVTIWLSLLIPQVSLAFTVLEDFVEEKRVSEKFVVLGSFHNLQSANLQRTRHSEQLGIKLSVTAVESGSGLLYRIVSGPHQEATAQAIKTRIKTSGIADAWIWRNAEHKPFTSEQLIGKTGSTHNPSSASGSSFPGVTHIDTQQKATSQDSTSDYHSDEHEPSEAPVERSWSLRGYLKSYELAQKGIDIDNAPPNLVDEHTLYQSQNSLRLMFEGSPYAALAWELHYELTPVFYSNAIAANPINTSTVKPGANSYRISDIDPILGTATEKSAVLENLDRLNLQLRLESGDLTIGRQAISFGSARAINPTDVFLPFEIQTLNQEYRVGIDAIRYQRPMGNLGELDMGIILGRDAEQENSAVFLQTLNNISGTDIQGTIMRFSEQNLAGFGIQSALGNFGFWFEGAHVWGNDEYTRISTGLDYSISENVFGMIEYHFNGAGSRSANEYLGLFDDFAYQKGGVFLLGQNYLIPSVSWTASPLLSITLQSILNLDDSSAFLNLSGDYSISDNLYSSFGIYVFTGDHLKFTKVPPNILLGSEYGINPDLIFFSLRYYF